MRTSVLLALVFVLPVSAQEIPTSIPHPEQRAVRVTRPSAGTVLRIEVTGVRRIPAETVRRVVSARAGEPLDAERIAADVRTLERLGWFDSVTANVEEIPLMLASAGGEEAAGLPRHPLYALTFAVEERPFLEKVEFRGLRALKKQEMESALRSENVKLKTATFRDPEEVWRTRRIIVRLLAEMGFPLAEVGVREERSSVATARVKFIVREGPRVPVCHVEFPGAMAFSQEQLRREMTEIAPHAAFAGMRGKTIYTEGRLARDIERVERFYRSRGYLEAKFGAPQIEMEEIQPARGTAGGARAPRLGYHIVVPLEEGARFHLAGAEISGAQPAHQEKLREFLKGLEISHPASEESVEQARQRMEQAARRLEPEAARVVSAQFVLDRELHAARIEFVVRDAPQYVVQRIEFTGHHRLPDRYFRRGFGLLEGEVFDPEKLERSLAKLARHGFVRPVGRNNLEVTFDDELRTAQIRIKVEELGRQRISLIGSQAMSRSTMGLAYSVFNLLGGDEFLMAQWEGGPERVEFLLGAAKEGIFGSPASAGISLLGTIFRPALGGRRERLFTSRSIGIVARGEYPLAARSRVTLEYERSRMETVSRLGSPSVVPGLTLTVPSARSSRSAVTAGWTRETLLGRSAAQVRVAGGLLGGTENVLRGDALHAAILGDPVTRGRNSWAARARVSAAGGYGGRALPLASRLYPGEEVLRGFRAGEAIPLALVSSTGAEGAMSERAEPRGSNLLATLTLEYRAPLHPRAEVAGFADGGSSWLLPKWLATERTPPLAGTNGLLRLSTGIELRLKIPLLDAPLRFYYATNPLRLAERFRLRDGSALAVRERRAAFGWAIGTFF
jgi:outer membrane protein insertion porin family